MPLGRLAGLAGGGRGGVRKRGGTGSAASRLTRRRATPRGPAAPRGAPACRATAPAAPAARPHSATILAGEALPRAPPRRRPSRAARAPRSAPQALETLGDGRPGSDATAEGRRWAAGRRAEYGRRHGAGAHTLAREMASDGSLPPTWTGEPFSYLPKTHRAVPHGALGGGGFARARPPADLRAGNVAAAHPKPLHILPGAPPASYRDAPAAAPPAAAARSARTGTWNGPAPRGAPAADLAAAAARPAPPPVELGPVRLAGGGLLPPTALATAGVRAPAAITAALDAGVTCIDVAADGDNLGVVREALAGRESLPFLTLALPAGAADPAAAAATALDAIGAPAADVVLLGGPPAAGTAAAAWASATAALAAGGRARAVGLADWGLADVEAALAAGGSRPALLRVEAHPLLAQRKLVGVCRRRGVPVVAAAPLGGGRLELLEHPVVVAAAAAAGKTPAEVRRRRGGGKKKWGLLARPCLDTHARAGTARRDAPRARTTGA